MPAAALAPQDQHPAAELAGDPGGKPTEALLDGPFVGSISRSGSGMIVFRLARNGSIRRALVPGRSAEMPRMSASWTGASAPTQASTIRRLRAAVAVH